MPNLAAVLKEEIRRLARKEVKAEVRVARRLLAQHRREIARLKRSLGQVAARVAAAETRVVRTPAVAAAGITGLKDKLFSVRSVKAQRSRLGLSAHNYGKLIGVSGLTIYNWEAGKTRPRAAQMAKLVSMRGIGRREAQRLLQAAG